jgi:hypothetical protein
MQELTQSAGEALSSLGFSLPSFKAPALFGGQPEQPDAAPGTPLTPLPFAVRSSSSALFFPSFLLAGH